MSEIIREQTLEEKKDFVAIETPTGIPRSPEDEFNKKLAEQGLKVKSMLDADGLQLPFADKAAREEWKSFYEAQVAEQKKKYGFIKVEEIKTFKGDLSKYFDLKNFDLLESGERLDDNLSKRYAKQIFLKYKVYQFKGYYHKYTVMEDGIIAVSKAEKKAK